jgi:hypothetical protein
MTTHTGLYDFTLSNQVAGAVKRKSLLIDIIVV